MANILSPGAEQAGSAASIVPVIRRIGHADLVDALRAGVADFKSAPTHAVFLAVIYPVIGLVLADATFSLDALHLLFPAIAGFAILGPIAAIGLYEISRLREQGHAVTWRNALGVIHARSIMQIALLAAVLAGLFVGWMFAAGAIFSAFFGDDTTPKTLASLVQETLTTRAGWEMIIVGNVVGALFAIAAFLVSVIAVPMLLDRDTDAATAVYTSMRAVVANPRTMFEWGLIVAALLVAGSIPLLMGLAVVLPVLGHATWHLYRKVVV